MPPAKKYVRCTGGFVLPVSKDWPRGRVVKAGGVYDASDPVVKGYPDLFEPVEDAVERATQAPGEKRIVPRGKKKPAKKAG